MKAESNVRPLRLEIETMNELQCDIIFYDQIEKVIETIEGKETEKYTFNMYRIEGAPRPTLQADIEAHYADWLDHAKKVEFDTLAEGIRKRRDALLLESDKFLLADYPLVQERRNRVMEYRQELRDMTLQEGFPYEVKWPMI